MKTNAELMEENAWFIELIREEKDCKAWLYQERASITGKAVGFNIQDGIFFYRVDDGEYRNAAPIKTERRYLDKVEQMQWLVDHDYVFRNSFSYDVWVPLKWKNSSINFYGSMWRNCGLQVGKGFDELEYEYHPEWIKEVEV